MGHFSHNCKLTGLPITGGTPAVLIAMKLRGDLYDNSEKSLMKYGKTYQCSNEGPRLKFIPCWYPIKGDYNDYGGMENIIEDDNTKALEEYYGLSIQQIVDVLTSGRKDDGYCDSLKPIKDDKADDEYGKPVYQERYKELLSISGMWVHREVYEKLTSEPTGSYFDKLDLGTPQLLIALGFEQIEDDATEKRYNLRFEKDGLIVNSDGTWINLGGNRSVYNLKDFAKYCEEHDVVIDIENHGKKDRTEQVFDYIIPTLNKIVKRHEYNEEEQAVEDKRVEEFLKTATKAERKEFIQGLLREESNRMTDTIRHLLLHGERYTNISQLTRKYFEHAKQGKLKQNAVEFWRFDHYMFVMGCYYDIVGTGPQDGEHKDVQKVLTISAEVNQQYLDKYDYEEEEA